MTEEALEKLDGSEPLELEVDMEELEKYPVHNYSTRIDQEPVNLEKGDVISYKWRGEEKQAFFIGYNPQLERVRIRKTEDTYMWIKTGEIKGKVEDPEIQEGLTRDELIEEREVNV